MTITLYELQPSPHARKVRLLAAELASGQRTTGFPLLHHELAGGRPFGVVNLLTRFAGTSPRRILA